MARPIFTVTAIRAIESRALETLPGVSLMDRAGAAAARLALELAGDRPGRLLALAGPGNNGGDAIEAATCLRRIGVPVDVLLAADPARLPADAARALARWQAAGGTLTDRLPAKTPSLVMDGLFGIGISRPIDGAMADLIAQINRLETVRLALDIPSGIAGDTGRALGATIRAHHTLTFIGLKPGLLTLDGTDHAGQVHLDTLALDRDRRGASASGLLCAPPGWLIDESALALVPLTRPHNFHKGSAGTVAILGGAPGMVGAALLAGRAALRLGAGKVLVGLLDDQAPRVDADVPELMLQGPCEALEGADTIAAGPGLGQSPAARQWLAQALSSTLPLVLDADALNLIALEPSLAEAVAARSAPTVLTPHPAEAARLLACDTATVQADRLDAARRLATRFGSTVILKGNGSIVQGPAGPFAIIASGNPGMAAAGMGDTLTGLVAALLAQGLDALAAAQAGAWLHGAAGDRLAGRCGPLGLAASELADEVRALLQGADQAPAARPTFGYG